MAGEANNLMNNSDGDVYLALRRRNCELYKFVVYTVVMGTIIVVGVVGNSLAFVVFWKDNIKTPASFLFQSLALVDLTLLLLLIPHFPMDSFVSYTDWMQGYSLIVPYVFVYIHPLLLTIQTASIWVVVLVAVNRYIAVCFPFKALRLCTVSKAKKQLAFVLLFAVLFNIPNFAERRIKYVTYHNGTSHTPVKGYTKLGEDMLYHIVYHNVMYVIFLLNLPLSTLTVLNIRMIQALKARRRNRTEMLTCRQQNDNNVTFVLIIVVIVLVICQLPALINQVMWNVSSDQARNCGGYQFYLQPISNLLVVLNSAVNFVIYAVFNKRFRHVLTLTVCGCRVLEDDEQRRRSAGRRTHVNVNNCGAASPHNGNDNDVIDTLL